MSSILFAGPAGLESHNEPTQNKPAKPPHPSLRSESIEFSDKKHWKEKEYCRRKTSKLLSTQSRLLQRSLFPSCSQFWRDLPSYSSCIKDIAETPNKKFRKDFEITWRWRAHITVDAHMCSSRSQFWRNLISHFSRFGNAQTSN